MIYLRTGANGTGKTLLTLKEVYEKALKESRPVYHNGRFAPVVGGPLDKWTQIDIKDWESIPDGAIFVVDECHNDFPIRSSKETVPGYVSALAEHRRRGFDFYMLTQHPMNIDPFVRRLIGSPGWHQHLKRVSGAPLVSVIEWPAVNDQPQKNGSGASGAVRMVSYPKEVYQWYTSTSLDTAKVKIPWQAKVLAACVVLIPLLIYYGWTTFQARQPFKPQTAAAGTPGAPGAPAGSPAPAAPRSDKPVLTTSEYVASFAPRIPGLPHTAPRYDEATKPTTAPFPAACVKMGDRCNCYTQQGTKLMMDLHLCKSIVAEGFFQDWGQQPGPQGVQGVQTAQATPMQGNPGASPAVTLPERVAAAAAPISAGDAAALSSMRIGRRPAGSF